MLHYDQLPLHIKARVDGAGTKSGRKMKEPKPVPIAEKLEKTSYPKCTLCDTKTGPMNPPQYSEDGVKHETCFFKEEVPVPDFKGRTA